MRVVLIGLLGLLTGCGSLCTNTIKQEIKSPDNRFVAVSFIRDCGATTDFSPQVYLRRADQEMSETGNVFVGDHSDKITISWETPNTLIISSDCKVISTKEEFEGIRIVFKPLP
jgi:hypothetical protein